MPTTNILKLTVAESSLAIKMGFLRRYVGIIALQFLYILVFCHFLMLSPTARFYLAENVWLAYLFCSAFCASYLILFKFQRISFYLLFHVGILGATTTFVATCFDLMFLLQTLVLLTIITTILFLYSLQSKFDFNVWTIIITSSICITFGSFMLNVLLVGSEEDSVLTIFMTVLLILYHSYGSFKILKFVFPNEYFYAVISLHLLPINLFGFAASLNKCLDS